MVKGAARSLLLLLISSTICLAAQSAPGRQGSGRAGLAHVFLVTLDTLRADHVECYGYKGVKTPALNRLARDGIRFEQAFTPSPITNTSHASILTGLLPSSHGVADFAIPLPSAARTIAELLHERGYHTAAFVSAVILDSKSLAPGFERGFDYYFNFPANLPKKSSRYGRVERRAETTIAAAEGWLSRRRNGPQFAWVHLYDPHDPYDPPAPYAQEYRARPYDGEIAYVDNQLLKFLNFLQQHGWYENSLIIAVGDHGEGLGEHGEDTHGIFLYDSTLRVPLIVKLPKRRSAGMSVSTQVRTIDISPTVLDVLGVRSTANFDGESLLPLIAKQSLPERVALGETDYPFRFGWAPLKSARASGFKYIEAPRPELYNLGSDARETKNIYEPWDAQVQKLRGVVAELRAKTAHKGSPNPAAPDPKTIEELKALGYLGNNPGATTALGPSTLPDPKDKIELHNLLHAAMLADEDGDTARAQASLKSALAKDPDSPVALLQLGQLELGKENYRDAAVHLTRARILRPEDSSAALSLGKAFYGLGDLSGALEALEASLKLAAGQFEARFLLGRIYAARKNWDTAQDQLEAALLLDPTKPEAHIELARVLLAEKQAQAALEHLKQARALAPQDPDVFDFLSSAYAAMGNQQQAAVAAARARVLRSKKEGAARGASRQY